VTARTLETVIRLATAACKIRLEWTIRLQDVLVAINILEHCMKRDVGSDADNLEEGGEEGVMEEEDDEDDEDDDDDDDDDDEDYGKKSKGAARRRRRAGKKAVAGVDKKRKARDGRRSGAPSPAPRPSDDDAGG
jgi:DNA replication licensing factor MCM3